MFSALEEAGQKTILYNNLVKDQFQEFFSDEKVFTLGVCNGCQMLSNLKDIIPGAEFWPSLKEIYQINLKPVWLK